MSSDAYRFRVGEQVMYPQILVGDNGRHQVVQTPWLIKAIFPVSQLALITQSGRQAASIHVNLEKLQLYN